LESISIINRANKDGRVHSRNLTFCIKGETLRGEFSPFMFIFHLVIINPCYKKSYSGIADAG
jgi:hypothetical protein